VTDLLLAGARVLTPWDDLGEGWVAVSAGRIEAVGSGAPPPAGATVDLGGRLLAPGYVDVHVHGGGGAHFMGGDADACRRAARFHASHGTTSLLATTLSAAPERLEAAVRGIAAAMRDEPVIAGIHLEGPFLNPRRRGAQEAEHLREPDVAELERLFAAGAVRLVSLAPELPGAVEAIRNVVAAGAVAGLAHTDATFEQARAGIEAGARHAIHTFNGMRPLHHREPGILGAVLDDAAVTCEVIADGHHVHPAVVRLVHRAKGAAGTVLVTDAMEAAGLPDGVYTLGETPVEVRQGRATTPDGSLAGSTLTMDAAVRHACDWGVPLPDALAMASATPARVIGMDGRKGRIAPGLDADLVVLDTALRPLAAMVAGRWVGDAP
jgi:N-acetylglucosamine-6-phosphate deacetylase